MHLFYTPDISATNYTFSEEESKHAIRVLRLNVGDSVQLIDGVGGWYEATINDANAKRCSVEVTKTIKNFEKRNWNLHIAIAPTKNMDRLEWFIEKATEIGIDEISLLNCNNSERTIVKLDRLNKVAIAAMKQSLKAYLPTLNELIDFQKFISSTNNFNGEKYIAHCHARTTLPHLKTLYTSKQDVLILIGPEGDFSLEEINLAIGNGFKEINLGTARLRTETAALYACTTLTILNHD